MIQPEKHLRFKKSDGSEYPKWKPVMLGSILDFATSTSKSKYIQKDGEYLIVDMGSINQSEKLVASKKTNNQQDMLKKNDLVMPKDDIGDGLIIGKVAIIDCDNTYICGDHVFKIICKLEKYNSYYLKSLFNNGINNRKIKKICQGSPILGLGKENLKCVELCITLDDKEQQKIGEFFSNLDNLINAHQQKLSALQDQKIGLIQQIFTRKKIFSRIQK